jgi:DNA-binding GntR family transcriptional regulator
MLASQISLARLKDLPLRVRVQDSIRDAILSGKLNPGDHLRELHLARELGVSQNTVREALLQLEQTGLVIRTPNKFTMVTRLSSTDICERVAVRLMLEPPAWPLAARRMGESERAQLQAVVREMESAASAQKAFDLAQADLRFHGLIWQWTGNQFLCQTLSQVTLPLFAFVSLLRNRRADCLESTPAEHAELFELLAGGDDAAIRAAAHRHITNVYREFLPPGKDTFDS